MSALQPARELNLGGLAVSDGVVLANAIVLPPAGQEAIPLYRVPQDGVADELARLDRALADAAQEVSRLIDEVTTRIGPAQANIFVAQKMMVEDTVLRAEIAQAITDDRMNAQAALERTLNSYEKLLQEVDDEYLSERASDIGELRRRLHDLLATTDSGTGITRVQLSDEPHIIVAQDLTPGETVQLNKDNTVGFITERGGKASHAAILARAMGIPAVSGIPKLTGMIQTGDRILLNGDTGEVVLHPSEETLAFYPSAHRHGHYRARKVAPVPGFTVRANIGLSTEVESILAVGAEGIGLYRTEFEFLAAGMVLDEEAQYERYRSITEALEGAPFYARILDLGGDKDAPYLNLPKEENPALGCRGARLLLARPDLLVPQARAMARASIFGPIHLIYPMIVDVDQFLILRERIRQAIDDIPGHNLHHGIMFEVPSACLMARELYDVIDFGSIGTNDLIQYIFAIDRNNERVAEDYDLDKPVFWRLLGEIAEAARDHGKPLSICGEIGGQPQFLPRLLDLGVDCVSVSPRIVGLARVTARKHLGAAATG